LPEERASPLRRREVLERRLASTLGIKGGAAALDSCGDQMTGSII
jgi:hypothetical protein